MQLTSRLGLGLFGTGLAGDVQPDEAADISGINNNFRKLDTNIGFFLCTSTTHPASPYQGMAIYETDTKRGYVYDGAAFQLAFDGNFTSGLRGTTAQRDAYWGQPGTAAARVVLAKKGPLWYNTDKGWEEKYSALKGDSGADVNVAQAAGWYPSGSGVVPRISAKGAATSYGTGVSLITTQANYFAVDQPAIGFANPVVNGTGAGFRFVVPSGLPGIYVLSVEATFTSAAAVFVKQNDVGANVSNTIARGVGGAVVGGLNTSIISRELTLDSGDYLIIGWQAGAAGTVQTGSGGNGIYISLAWSRPRVN